jgi:pimeloyl-ACP methyl ester carboxylesterase
MNTVTSADGTPIAVEVAGSGPAVVLVGGAFNDRTTVAGLAAALQDSFTTVVYDRRGRGDSGDTPPYAVQREVEDLRAVTGSVDGPVALLGHSSGAILVLEAALAGVPARRLVAYEPPWLSAPGVTDPIGPDELSALVQRGDRDGAVEAWMTRVIGLPPGAVAGMRESPAWGWFTGLAHTLPYDMAVTGGHEVPAARLAAIDVPTLVVDGGNSPAEMRGAAAGAAAAIPGARYETVAGEDHAILQRPAAFVPLLREFLLG